MKIELAIKSGPQRRNFLIVCSSVWLEIIIYHYMILYDIMELWGVQSTDFIRALQDASSIFKYLFVSFVSGSPAASEEAFSPWEHGETRLCELPIEHHFGHLRRAQPNAELSVESYLRMSAINTLRKVRKVTWGNPKDPRQPKHEAPMSEKKLRDSHFRHFQTI